MPFFQEVLSLEMQYVEINQKILNCIQTNGTLINDEWANFLYSNKFSVGISCDGPERYHNSSRISPHGNCFNFVYKGIIQLQKLKTTSHVIAVITKQSLCGVKDIFEFFYKNNLPFHPKPCYELDLATNTPTAFSITPEEYADFMIEIFNIWWEKDNPNFKIRNLFNILVGLKGGKATLCENSGGCHSFLTIEPNGDIKPCDSFPQEKYTFGNILEQGWVEILNGSEYKNFLTEINESRKFCVNCKWSSVCKGGCLRYSFDFANDKWRDKNIFCESKKRLFEHISNKLK